MIGNDVWIGHGALFLSRLSNGDGSVIGTVEVANKNVQDYAMVEVNPVKLMRYELDEDYRKELKKLCYLVSPHEKLRSNCTD